MKSLAAALATGFLLVSATGLKAQETKMQEDVRAVAPALEKYTQDMVMGDLWGRPDLTPRDRSVVTLAALIARGQTVELPRYLNLALDNGVKPQEISEIILTPLQASARYTGMTFSKPLAFLGAAGAGADALRGYQNALAARLREDPRKA